jgi:tryptophanyl-tRNA synthetase
MKRVFTGFRPTGRQHIGNYVGTIQNCIAMQEEYQCVYCIVDVHALTTLENTEDIGQDTYEMALDWLAAGIDPEKCIIFVQSHVPQVMELYTFLSMVTPLSWLLRVPTFKEKVKLHPHNVNCGLVGYPVLMTADIALYKGEFVPVGEDQLPHLELAREIVRRFNSLFGPVFPEPQAKLTRFPLIMGLDGVQKMSKSCDNQIDIAASPQEIMERVKTAVTDPARRYRTDVGHPEVCNVFSLHKIFTPDRVEEIASQCRSASIGCVACKKMLAQSISAKLEPFREKRKTLAARPDYVLEVLNEGARRAEAIATETMKEVRESIKLFPRGYAKSSPDQSFL